MRGGEAIGAVGAAGAPTPDGDEICAKAGLASVASAEVETSPGKAYRPELI